MADIVRSALPEAMLSASHTRSASAPALLLDHDLPLILSFRDLSMD
jgi:hypothetical protein